MADEGSGGRKSPSRVRGQSPGGGSGGFAPKAVMCNIMTINLVSVHHLAVKKTFHSFIETTQFYGFIYYESRLYAIVPKCQHFAV